jgi:hypothetical protein
MHFYSGPPMHFLSGVDTDPITSAPPNWRMTELGIARDPKTAAMKVLGNL